MAVSRVLSVTWHQNLSKILREIHDRLLEQLEVADSSHYYTNGDWFCLPLFPSCQDKQRY